MTENDLNGLIVRRIKELRKERNLSQDELSELADLQIKYMNRIENFKTGLTVKTLDKIIKALGIDYHTFFDFDKAVELEPINKSNDAQLNKIANELLKDVMRLKEHLNDPDK